MCVDREIDGWTEEGGVGESVLREIKEGGRGGAGGRKMMCGRRNEEEKKTKNTHTHTNT